MKKEEQKKEALARMELLKLHPNVINDFSESNRLNYSERSILYWLNEDYDKMIKEFEQKTGNLVYHVIFNEFFFGRCLTLLFVSRYEEEWELDREDLNSGYAMSYVINMDDPVCSEYGSVGIAMKNGGILRIS